MNKYRFLAAAAVALFAFSLYRATLLPGFDFGDTGSFQATVGSELLTPRDAYPLYFAIGATVVRLTHLEPASALNLASAIEAAVAAAAIVFVAAELSGSLVAAVAAALLFVVSYTFWSQAIIAEVYALHALFVATTMWLLLRWSRQPSLRSLTAFFAVYALGFGNHLSMILLLPGYAVFLLLAAPGGWRSMLTPKVVLVAALCAVGGAAQYAWNLRTLWFQPHPPDSMADALRTFWFDVTKSDWRDTMVLNVPASMLADRVHMYWFDLRQQFGPFVPAVAVAGLVALFVRDRTRGVLMLLLYLVNALFAFSYNVGDTHVFFLPSHLMVVLLAAAALGLAHPRAARGAALPRALHVVAGLFIVYAAVRAYNDFPALDRSADRRPTSVVERLAGGLDDQHALLLTDLNWQIANGLSYYARVPHPELATARMPDVLLYAPALIHDNAAISRRVFLTERARSELSASYGPLVPTAPDPSTAVPPLAAEIDRLPAGTAYVFCVLRPSRDLPLDRSDVAGAARQLGGSAVRLPDEDYVAMVGSIGGPTTIISGNRPFRQRVDIHGVPVEIRMESWLATDTIRRMGFGHVIAHHHHSLIVERGISFVAFDDRGSPIRTSYRSNIFAPQPRYVCYR